MEYMDFKKKDDREVLRLERFPLEKGELPVLHYPLLDACGMVKHCFTTRGGGASKGMFESLNLSFTRGDDEADVQENYARVASFFGTDKTQFVCSDQTHTTNVRRVGKEDAGYGVTRPRSYKDVDGLVTDEPGIVLSTFYADCVPLFFVDPVHRAIGLSHSGWRGTVGRMGAVTLSVMQREFHTIPEDVLAAVGPSICQDCYEVSEDVADAFYKEFPGHEKKILLDKGNGKYQLDLWKTNEIILREAGIVPEHLAVTNICTCCNSRLLFSHRASHGKRGNLGAFMQIHA